MSAQEIIHLVIRVLPAGEELDIELPLNVTVKEIIDGILDEGAAPRSNEWGEPYFYDLQCGQDVLPLDRTIKSLEIQDGTPLILIPQSIVGGSPNLPPLIRETLNQPRQRSENRTPSPLSGKLAFRLPTSATAGVKVRAEVRIAQQEIEDYLLQEGLEESEIQKIEISRLMKVALLENSADSALVIKALSSEEQLITDAGYTRWLFDITPLRIGLTSILLQISLLKNVEGLGKQAKDVFLFEQEIIVGIDPAQAADKASSFDGLSEIAQWSDVQKAEVIEHISDNQTGQALSVLTNHFQQDRNVQSSLVLLKSQYNQGKNMVNLNLIEPTQWWMIQSKINYSILQLTNQLSDGQQNPSFPDFREIGQMMQQLY